MLVAVQLSVLGLYLPPVFSQTLTLPDPPQTIISLPVQTAVCTPRASGRVGGAGGCPTVGAGIVSAAGVQVAAVISAPDDHFTAGPHRCVMYRPAGAPVVLVAVQLLVLGLYLPPVLK